MYITKAELILASGSPRRLEMLRASGLDFIVVVPGADETPHDGESPEVMVKRLALLKARDVAKQNPAAWVLGADTTVVMGDVVMGKPASEAEAATMLSLLQGNVHEVWGGFALINCGRKVEHVESHVTKVRMQPLTAQAIGAYVKTGEPLDKAGAYAAQGIGAGFIAGIEGSYTNVVGLPLAAVLQALEKHGAIAIV